MAETDTASTISPSVSTAVTYAIAPVSQTGAAGQAFNSLYGYWLSDPLVLPGTPVSGSVVRWTATVPAGTTLTVETSINNGASWDAAINDQNVPRLHEGDTITQTVLARITMTRPSSTATSPTVTSFELSVSTDASVDEVVPIAHGVIDKVDTTATSGTAGGGSASTASSGTGVFTRGGGQSGGGVSIKIHATDPSRTIKRNQWQQPFTIPSGTNYATAAQAMVLNRLPTQVKWSLSSTTVTTPLLIYGVDQGGDPWQDIQELAQAVGYEAFFDAAGVFVFRPTPDPRYGEPVWVFDETNNPTMVQVKRELSDEDTFNYVVVVGQGTSSANPVAAYAFDNDPSSPTYVNGPYGAVTTRLTFPLYTTQDQCQQAANAILLNSLGAADTVTVDAVPMPALEPGDVVELNVPDTKAAGTYVINSITTPLSPGEAQEIVLFRQSTNTNHP